MPAVEQLLDEHAAALRSYLRARCGDADLTEDLMQDVALRLVRAAGAGRIDAGRNVRGYLFRTAANVWRDHLRRELVRRRGSGEPVDAAGAAADERLLELELTRAVRQAIAALPTPQREVVELRHGSGLTFREIAARLGRPLGTVLGQMRAALQKIGTAIDDYR
jgi:RNA polymerase sigma-70 factor (ECF subfamily)